MTPKRVAAGVPCGGQFAPDARSRPAVTLKPDEPVPDLVWEPADPDEPDELSQQADSALGSRAYWALEEVGNGQWKAELVARDACLVETADCVDFGYFDSEKSAKSAAAKYEIAHADTDGPTAEEMALVASQRAARDEFTSAQARYDRVTANALRSLVLGRHPNAAALELRWHHGLLPGRNYSVNAVLDAEGNRIPTRWDNDRDSTLSDLAAELRDTGPSVVEPPAANRSAPILRLDRAYDEPESP